MRHRETIFSAVTFLVLYVLAAAPWSCANDDPPGLYATTAPSDLASLLAVLQMEDSDIREHAATALGKMGDSRAVLPLISVLTQDRDAKVREHAATALGRLKDDRARLPLIEVMRNDPDPVVREHAAVAVGVIGKTASFEVLLEMMSGRGVERGDPRALKALRETEAGPDSGVRYWVAEAIRRIEGR